ncbi:hypothetical protein EIP91_000131 [Steccherinum ochraceum]|uniref:AB hydrolase-1 domain-containing protein n=1 Tax=Steccherinum ochraceum TaxID=92696 RepID=A0A4R0RZN7_9APHY|nr:hypothetical protein EIP91_000131 [Steccherinum ochraceum]
MSATSESPKYKEIKIPSATPLWNLDAWQYVPEGKGTSPCPVIVMAHGLSGNKTMGLKQYAEIYVQMGYACVLFDYRRWGASDGTPRQVVKVAEQLEDYRTVIKYCRQQPAFDPNRVVVWGTSFAGGHAVSIASEPQLNVFAAIGQCPYLGVTATPPFSWTLIKTATYAILDSLKLKVGLSPILVPACALPGEVGVMNAPDSKSGMFGIVENSPGAKYPNTINASSIFELQAYSPKDRAKNIQCPVLVVHCETDTLCLTPGADATAAASSHVEVVRFKDCGHFEIYPGAKFFDDDVKLHKEWLQKHVPV